MTYDAGFYDAIRSGCRASATDAMQHLLSHIAIPESVVDVGCGEGWWGKQFADAGARVVGFDVGAAPEVQIPVTACDLTERIPTEEQFGLAICLEVAEHLPERHADHLVSELVRLAPGVLFSAAMARQGGTGHVNCQPPAYWAEKFAAHGYGCNDEIRLDIWDEPDIEPWYKSNLLLFSRGFSITRPARHIIHPDLWLEPR